MIALSVSPFRMLANGPLERRRCIASAWAPGHPAARSKRWLAGSSARPLPTPTRTASDPEADSEGCNSDSQDEHVSTGCRTMTQDEAPCRDYPDWEECYHCHSENQGAHVRSVGGHS